MKSRIALLASLTALLLFSAAPALGADQEVEVQVLPAGALSLDVQQEINLRWIVVGGSNTQPFSMNLLNTTDAGWQVTVGGPDLRSFDWATCDENGCYDRAPTDPLYTIDNSNVVVQGGDACSTGMGCDPAADTAITAYSAALGESPALIMEGTAEAYGNMGFGPPAEPSVQLTIPGGATPNMYWTTLTYTIMASTP